MKTYRVSYDGKNFFNVKCDYFIADEDYTSVEFIVIDEPKAGGHRVVTTVNNPYTIEDVDKFPDEV
jgi:hypothetical protein